MKQISEADVLAKFQQHAVGNRQELEASLYAGCASCCAVFDGKDVQDWYDEWDSPEKQNRVKRWTAMCPRCGKPTVVGSSTGLLEDQAYLPIVRAVLVKRPKNPR